MANVVNNMDYNVETPNTTNSEVQMTAHNITTQNNSTNNKIQDSTQNVDNNGLANTMQTYNATTKSNNTQQITNIEPVVSQTAIQVPSDFYDNTVQGYLDAYNQGVAINDYQAQINALNAIDKYRKANGYSTIYTNDIYTLTNQRTAKIKNQIREYEDAIYQAQLAGDTATVQAVNQQLEAYKKMVNYSESVNNSATYLGSVEYKSNYDTIINGIVSQLLTDRFIYDPSDDEALIKAQEYATNQIYESMNAKGILDSTMTAQVISEAVSNLTATYEQMSRDEFYNNLERLQTSANLIMNLEQTQYDRWLANVQMKLEYYQAQKDEESYQWNRVNQLGYVDNEASIILGVPVGTISPAKREAIEEAQAKTEEMYNQLYTDIALAEAKAKLDYAYGTTTNGGSTVVDTPIAGSNGTTIYSDKMSDTDKKNIIKEKLNIITVAGITEVQDGEITVTEAIEEIYANFKPEKVAGALSDILGMTEKEALDYYNSNIVNNLLSELKNGYGDITEENRAYVEREIIEAVDSGYILPEMAESLGKEVEKEIYYNQYLEIYANQVARKIETAKELSKKDLKKVNLTRPSDNINKDIVNTIGETRYEALVSEIQAMEEELEAILKDKGIEW